MANASTRRFVWDLPTRIFHWSLVLLIGFSWWSAESERMEWHYWSGLALCVLIPFRIIWGIVGSDTARFAQFLKGPRKILAYLRSEKGPPTPTTLGHNPLGGWSVVVLLAVIAVQILSGLFAVDVDGVESGPLSFLVDSDQGRTAAEIHETTFNILLALSGLHVFSVLFYLIVWRWNLINRMVTGYDFVSVEDNGGRATKAGAMPLVFALLFSLALTYGIINGFWLN